MTKHLTKLLILAIVLIFIGGCGSSDTTKKDVKSDIKNDLTNLKQVMTDLESDSDKKIDELKKELDEGADLSKDEVITIWQDMKDEYDKSIQKIKDLKIDTPKIKTLQDKLIEDYQKIADNLQASIDDAEAASDKDLNKVIELEKESYNKSITLIQEAKSEIENLGKDKKQ